jgi:hypothetical protein
MGMLMLCLLIVHYWCTSICVDDHDIDGVYESLILISDFSSLTSAIFKKQHILIT